MNAPRPASRYAFLTELWSQVRGGKGPGARVTRGGGAALSIKIAGTAILFLNHLILTRVLGPAIYGEYIYTITWVNILAVIGTMGMETVAVRYVGLYTATGKSGFLYDFLSRGFLWSLSVSIILALLVCFVVDFLSESISASLYLAFLAGAILLPVQVASQYWSAVARGFQRIVLAMFPMEVLRPFCFGGVVLGLYFWLGHRPDAATTIGVNIGVTGLVVVLTLYGLKYKLTELFAHPKQRSNEWLAMTGPVLLIGGFNLILAQTDTVMIGLFIDTTAAGIYALTCRLTELMLFVFAALQTIAIPMIVELHAQEDERRLKRLLRVTSIIVLAGVIPVSLALIFGGKWLLSLFGAQFVVGYPALLILMVGQAVNALSGFVGSILAVTGHQTVVARILAYSAMSNVILNLFFIPVWGIKGAATSTAITMVMWNLSMLVVVIRRLGFNPSVFSLWSQR